MILFFEHGQGVYGLSCHEPLSEEDAKKLSWLFQSSTSAQRHMEGTFMGPHAYMVSPWSTNAVEIIHTMGIQGVTRVEWFRPYEKTMDPMLMQKFEGLDQHIFDHDLSTPPMEPVTDVYAYNQTHGLGLSEEECAYLQSLNEKYKRPLTDTEVFGFSQINSEHCRHKIFKGTFIIDGKTKDKSLFDWICETTRQHPNEVISAYKDNVALLQGPTCIQFAPEKADAPSLYQSQSFDSALTLKAETHNFPTTVEPFNGAATGSGGEIRDRMAGGQGSIPLAGTAVYMTPYSRALKTETWGAPDRPWLYQTPLDILIKASNGASDYGNKFGQPLIAGSVLTFEHVENDQTLGYDKVIMLAGGVGYAKKAQAFKQNLDAQDRLIMMGGDNYRIGMGGAAVSSVDTGALGSQIERNAIQRSNPEMQKRVANVIRAMVEAPENPIKSIHDHGAGGHLNCFSEILEDVGGVVDVDALPVGDPTLSTKEILGNESQERMGLCIDKTHTPWMEKVATRERAPLFDVGYVTGDKMLTMASTQRHETALCMDADDLFGNPPRMVLEDATLASHYNEPKTKDILIEQALENVLRLESVACKDWLTNKVDRCVTGRVAKQQTTGRFQLPLNNLGAMTLDYEQNHASVTSIGHSPLTGLIDPEAGSINSIAECLTNVVWAPLAKGLQSVSLSANWMWPCQTKGEDARLYKAVQACAQFALDLKINIPTGKDSLSMKQRYKQQTVTAPGTLIVSSLALCDDFNKIVEPNLDPKAGPMYYLNFSQDDFELGGSALYQTMNHIGSHAPTVKDAKAFSNAFSFVQTLIRTNMICAGHDVSSGGLITTLLEMCFANPDTGANIDLTALSDKPLLHVLFSEQAGVVFQTRQDIQDEINAADVDCICIGKPVTKESLDITFHDQRHALSIPKYRDTWLEMSRALDAHQTPKTLSQERYQNITKHALNFVYPKDFNGDRKPRPTLKDRPLACVIREKGSNSEREMAHALYAVGFDVRDVHMTDLVEGRETLKDASFVAAVGGFSHSDVLGSARGWAGSFMFHEQAKQALWDFFQRPDTLSLGVCNGCQLFTHLALLYPEDPNHPYMAPNRSQKFECIFTSVDIPENTSPMLARLGGSRLGIWSAHGEGRFVFEHEASRYNILGTYTFDAFPHNPNGSDANAAILASADGRHVVMMPHLERSLYAYNWGWYDKTREDQRSPWMMVFEDALAWTVR